MACKVLSLSRWCVIFTVNLAECRYVRELGMGGVLCMCAICTMWLFCGNTVRNASLSLWLVGRAWYYLEKKLDYFVAYPEKQEVNSVRVATSGQKTPYRINENQLWLAAKVRDITMRKPWHVGTN